MRPLATHKACPFGLGYQAPGARARLAADSYLGRQRLSADRTFAQRILYGQPRSHIRPPILSPQPCEARFNLQTPVATETHELESDTEAREPKSEKRPGGGSGQAAIRKPATRPRKRDHHDIRRTSRGPSSGANPAVPRSAQWHHRRRSRHIGVGRAARHSLRTPSPYDKK